MKKKKTLNDLSERGKEELALALILWKDFKTGGKMDIEATKQAYELADMLGVTKQFDALIPKVPPMKVEPRYPNS
jgi:hypothetical protein